VVVVVVLREVVGDGGGGRVPSQSWASVVTLSDAHDHTSE
jgi:hypothetical protein